MRQILSILSIILLMAIHVNGQGTRLAGSESGNATEAQNRIVKIYPNPAASYVTFDLQKNFAQGYTLNIYNGVLGKKVYESFKLPAKLTLDLTNYNPGVYVYHLMDATGRLVESGKFQVSR